MRIQSVVALLTLALAVGANADDLNRDGYETILLPLALTGASSDTIPGALGTMWQGEVWVSNGSTRVIPLEAANTPCQFENCSSPVTASYSGRLILGVAPSGMRGLLLQPRADDAQALTFSNRISEITRNSQPQGFQLPVVREHEFLTKPATLLGLQGGTAVRTMVRLYDPRRLGGLSFTVELLDSAGAPLGSKVVVTGINGSAPADLEEPGFASFDVYELFPIATTLDRYHLRIRPLVAAAEFWAMASVTDNATQQVLIVTPQ